MTWTAKEPGPKCYCGCPTIVCVIGGLANLMCIAHTKAEGVMFPLPAARPDKWPDMTHEEMKLLVEQGAKEHDDN